MSFGYDPEPLVRQMVEKPGVLILGGCAVAGGLLGLLGPFGTFAYLSMVQSIGFWTAIVSLAMALMYLTKSITEKLMGPRDGNRIRFDVLHTSLFIAAYLEPLYQFVTWMAGGLDVFDRVTMAVIIIGITLMLNGLRELFLFAMRVQTPPVHPVGSAVDRQESGSPQSANAKTRAFDDCPLLARLPDGAEPIIWSISSKDHYIDVRGPKETHTVLMRFSDAMRALGSMPGMQIHRSHWVAEAAVDHWFRDGHRLTLVTRDGVRLPVSKTYTDAVQTRWPKAERDTLSAA